MLHILVTQELLPFALLHFALERYYVLRWTVITFRVNSFITFCVDVIIFCVSITFCSDCMFLHFALVLHFVAIITFCGVTHVKECNCRKKEQCPLEGQYLKNNTVYQATVTSNTTTETYVGLATNFKERYRNHTSSFRNHKKKNKTELSKYI